jgi:hypothetical protein
MKSALRILAASVAGLVLASSAPAQYPYSPRGPAFAYATSTPDAGYAQVVGGQSALAPAAPTVVIPQPAVINPQPAEVLGQLGGAAGPWVVVETYAWAFGMHGVVQAHGVAAPVDLSVRDAIDNVSDGKGAAVLHVETGYGDVGLIADLEYLKVGPLDGFSRVESDATLVELLGMYRVCGSRCRQAGSSYFDVLAGARYYRFSHTFLVAQPDVAVDIPGSPAFTRIFVPAPDVPADHSSSWIDWVVGARAGVQVLDGLGIFARADIGGFGIGNGSHRACNILTGIDYQCCDCASLIAGYRWLKIDRSAGAGLDAFAMNVTLAGPFVGFGLRY